jgi:hypothetical protein
MKRPLLGRHRTKANKEKNTCRWAKRELGLRMITQSLRAESKCVPFCDLIISDQTAKTMLSDIWRKLWVSKSPKNRSLPCVSRNVRGGARGGHISRKEWLDVRSATITCLCMSGSRPYPVYSKCAWHVEYAFTWYIFGPNSLRYRPFYYHISSKLFVVDNLLTWQPWA